MKMEIFSQQNLKSFDPQLLTDIRMFHHCKVINALKENPSLVKASDCDGATLLHFATLDDNHCIMEHLIKMGANIDAQDNCGATPLSVILDKNRFGAIKILLDANADIYMKCENDLSALMNIIQDESASPKVLKLFFDKVKNDCSTVKDIIEEMTSIDCPIYHAILWRNPIITKSRLNGGWKVNARHAKTDRTALHGAVRLSDLENVKLLLDNGANINARDCHDRTPLSHLNVTNGSNVNVEILRLLLARGAWIYKSDVNDEMQIWNIFANGVKKLVKVLLDHGVNLSKMDKSGNTAVHYLASNKNEGCIELLEGKKFDPNFNDDCILTPLQRAANVGMPGNIKFLLDHGADPNQTNSKFMVPLFNAVMVDTTTKAELRLKNECVELLLQRGADPMCNGNGVHTVFDFIMSFQTFSLSKPILMHLAIQELQGTPITEFILDKINSHGYFRSYLDLSRQQMKKMQQSIVCESVTLFKFIAGNDDKIAKYARNHKIVKRLVRMNTKRATSHCKRYLKKRVTNAIDMAQAKQQAAVAVSNVVKLGNGCYSSVIDRIADYLNDNDVKNLITARK